MLVLAMMVLQKLTSGQSNLTAGRINTAHGRLSGIL